MSMASQLIEILKDPLSSVVRKKQRMLLGISLISILIINKVLIPTKINVWLCEFEVANCKLFLVITLLIMAYYICTFVIYGFADILAWRLAYNKSLPTPQSKENIQMWRSIIDNNNDGEEISKRSWFGSLPSRHAHLLSILRIIFEIFLPILIGLYAAFMLFLAIN